MFFRSFKKKNKLPLFHNFLGGGGGGVRTKVVKIHNLFSVAKATLETALLVRSFVRSSRYFKSIINQEFFKSYKSAF